jgi:hypothetical protein
MSKKVRISGKIRNSFRSDTQSNWENENPVLLKGEFGVVTNPVDSTARVKIGDGVTSWKNLDWWYGPTGPKGEKGEQGLQGIQGEKGDKGDSGKDAIAELEYNPESENAQSGKALAPIFQKKLEIWKNSTPYKQNSVVMTNISIEEQGPQTVFLKCLIDHTSGNAAPDPISDNLNAWDIVGYLYAAQAYTASKAASDIEGNYIPNTYATKEELRSAIGEALEGDY